MQINRILSLFVIIFIVGTISAAVGIDNPSLPHLTRSATTAANVNYSSVNTNNSQYLQGYTWLTNPYFDSWSSTYNATYATWAYNQTPSLTGYVLKTGDNMTGNLVMNNANISEIREISKLAIVQSAGGYGLTFNGTGNNMVNISYNPTLNWTNKNITISLWFKMNTTRTEQTLIKKNTEASAYDGILVSLGASSPALLCVWTGSAVASWKCSATPTVATVKSNTWHHWVTTIFTNATASYVEYTFDGAKVYSDTTILEMESNNENMYFGWRTSTSGLNGSLDEVNIWNRKLTDAEIAELYNSGQGVFAETTDIFSSTSTTYATNIVGIWHFDEATGTTANDFSGNSNTGTLQGTTLPFWMLGKVNPESTTQKSTGILFNNNLEINSKGSWYLGDALSQTIIRGSNITFSSNPNGITFNINQTYNGISVPLINATNIYSSSKLAVGTYGNSHTLYVNSAGSDDTAKFITTRDVATVTPFDFTWNSATPATNDQIWWTFRTDSSTTANALTARIGVITENVTHAGRSNAITLRTMTNGAEAESMRISNTLVNITTANLAVAGNITGNEFYAYVYNYSDAGYSLTPSASGVTQNYSGFYNTDSPYGNGIKLITVAPGSGGDKLQVQQAGMYEISFDSTVNVANTGIYTFSIGNNTGEIATGRCFTRLEGTGKIQSASINCMKRLRAYDNLTLGFKDTASPVQSVIVYKIGLRVKRVGN